MRIFAQAIYAIVVDKALSSLSFDAGSLRSALQMVMLEITAAIDRGEEVWITIS